MLCWIRNLVNSSGVLIDLRLNGTALEKGAPCRSSKARYRPVCGDGRARFAGLNSRQAETERKTKVGMVGGMGVESAPVRTVRAG